ncbi:conserved membrane protein of unknown function [Tenacibaculum soleae]|uniref:DUF4199 domain-containing protein n=1 Tax=Tenacibaculum soleae TaxID=447689 RepID=UPI003AB8A955
MNQIIKTKGINFGLCYGFYLILILLYAYAIDQNFFTSYWMMGLSILGFFVHGFWVIGSTKKAQNGYITFKQAFTVFFISNAIGFLLSTIMTILLFVVIDPELQNTLKELTINKTTEMMEGFEISADEIDKAVDQIREQDNYSVGAQLKAYFYTLIFASIFGLLFSLILKKNKEEDQY